MAKQVFVLSVLNAEVPLFAAKFTDAVNSYAKAAAMLTDFRSDGGETLQQIDIAIQTAVGLRSSIDGALQSLGGFRQSIASSPRVTTQYNHAKRHALAILDRFLAEIKSGSDRLAECQKLLGGIRAELPVSPVSAL